MSENDEFDLEFDEEFLKGVDNEEELYYTQRDTSKPHDEPPSKRLRPSSPPSPRQILQPLSSRKHHLLDIFSNKTSPTSPKPPKIPRIAPRPTGKSLALATLADSPKIPKKFPRTLSNEKILQPRTPNLNNSLDSPRTRQLSTEILQRTLVRKFPGPAGLLPDDLDPSTPSESLKYICLLAENDANVTKTSPEKIGDFCTQDTKKIFLEGAWMIMMDTLPQNFIEGYDIASIKESDARKVPRLAVVIQKIDQSSGNPRVTLKDISGTIEGIVHLALAVKYPSILHSGVVLLLQDVGILSTKRSFVKTRTIIFSTDNLIAAFSEKGILVNTPFLDAILNGTYEEMKGKMTARSKNEEGNEKIRKWGEDLGEKINSMRGSQNLEKKSIDRSEESIDRSRESIDRWKESIDRSKESIDKSKSIDKSEKSIIGDRNEESEDSILIDNSKIIDTSKKSINDNREELDHVKNSDFCDEDFAFEDDLFNQIDVSQFDNLLTQIDEGGEGRVIETVAVIEHRREEEVEKKEEAMETSNGFQENSAGFGDDLLNDTDSEDEYLSQIDLDAITRSASVNN